ncbi:alpha/beta fold hydrolase [Georgenia halophila]|uniref:alpha/beta fold hydrolase n=1 Tax=Georgenia halophila TaxID=620889 RepID=UPI003CD05B0C
MPAFARHFREIRFDHRGIGRSEPGFDDAYTTRSFAQDAVAVLDAAGAERAHIYRDSMGGRVAQWLAIDHADRVGALVLGATTAGDERDAPRTAQATADLASGDPLRLAARTPPRSSTRQPAAASGVSIATPAARTTPGTSSNGSRPPRSSSMAWTTS